LHDNLLFIVEANYEVISNIWENYDAGKIDPYCKRELKIPLSNDEIAMQQGKSNYMCFKLIVCINSLNNYIERQATVKDKFGETTPSRSLSLRVHPLESSLFRNQCKLY